MDKIKELEKSLVATVEHPEFKAGDNVSVHYKIKEGNKERVQIFKGDVIQINSTGVNKTFTVRKISNGVGVERIFPYFSPNIAQVEVHKVGKVRRAKIFYIRELKGKASRIKEKIVK